MRTTTDTQTLSMVSDVFQTDVKQVFDFIRCSNDKRKLLELVENDVYYSEMDDSREEAKMEKTKSTVINMLKENEPVEKICRYTECDEAYVEAIRKELETE